MHLLEVAREYLRVNNDEFDSEPDHIGIRTIEREDTESEYQVTGRFPEEESRGEIVSLDPQEHVLVDASSDLHELITDSFETVRSNVDVTPARISSMHVSETTSREDASVEENNWLFYTSTEADARFFFGVEQEITDDAASAIREVTMESLRELDEDVTWDDVKQVEFLFSDTHMCQLQTVRGKVNTPHPHRYYEGPTSVSDYVNALAERNDKELTELKEQETFEVLFKFDDDDFSDSLLREVGERVMTSFIESTLVTDWETKVEAERIWMGEFEYVSNTDRMKYYVRVPVVGDEIGVSKEKSATPEQG